jgi:hypothetical protein
MKIDGGCHCGYITYEGEANPDKASICHCTDCQKLSGSAFRTVVPVSGETLKMKGEPTIYVKTGESGNMRQQAFCPRCGSPIFSAPPGDGPKMYFIRLGTVRQRDQIVPKTQIWARSQQPWTKNIASVQSIEKQT